MNSVEKFYANTDINEGCWIWKAGKQTDGYGKMWLEETKKHVLTHRFSYELLKGVIPKHKELDHLCRNRICCNPEHLEVVTHKINGTRGIFPNSLKTYCKHGHKLIGNNVIINKKGHRNCRECKRISYRNIYIHKIMRTKV